MIVLSLIITQTKAQTPNTAEAKAGRLLVELAEHIKPESFIDTWMLKRKSWTETAAKSPTAKVLAQNTLALSSYISPASFKNSFSQKDFAKAVNKAKTYPEAFKVLQSLEEGFKPGTMGPLWSNRRGRWLHDLSVLK